MKIIPFPVYKEKKKGTVWVNIYSKFGDSRAHTTRKNADDYANRDRIACVEVPWEEGQGL